MASYLYRPIVNPVLPWEVDPHETARFNKILVSLLALSIVISIIIPFLEVAKPDRLRVTTIPPRLVKLVVEQKKKEVKPPPPPVQEIKEEPKPEKEPEKKPEVEPEKTEVKPEVKKESAKAIAKKHIAVFDALADLRELDDVSNIQNNQSLSNSQGQAATVTRNLITKNITSGSGGIQVAKASRSAGTGTLKGQNVTNVKSEIGQAIEANKVSAGGSKNARNTENIQLAFEKHKPAIFALYHRALRQNPDLQGRVNFKIKILPNGKVANCSIVSSELNDEALEKRLISKIRRINFGAMDVGVWEDTYLINFFPS